LLGPDGPKISVGMPVFNGEKYLPEAAESILAQDFPDFEFIISDNASTDGTRKLCEEYARRDPRVRYSRQEQNIGGPRNWNLVFGLSRGRYFKWASASDVWDPTFLSKTAKILDDMPDVVLCYTRTVLIDHEGREIQRYEDVLHLLEEDPLERFRKLVVTIKLNNAQSGLIRSEALRKNGVEGLYAGGDNPLMAGLALHGKYYELPGYLYYRRMSPGAATVLSTPEEMDEFLKPGKAGGVPLRTWRLCADLFRRIHRSPLDPFAKLRLDAFAGRFSYWHKDALWRELSSWVVRQSRK